MVEDSIRHARDGWLLSSLASAFEEKVAVRIEEVALARRNAHSTMAAALVYEAEESQQLRPRAIPLVHGVRVSASVGTQPLIEAGHRVVVRVYRIGGKEAAVLRIQQKHQAQQRGEQAGVDQVRVPRQDVVEQSPMHLGVP